MLSSTSTIASTDHTVSTTREFMWRTSANSEETSRKQSSLTTSGTTSRDKRIMELRYWPGSQTLRIVSCSSLGPSWPNWPMNKSQTSEMRSDNTPRRSGEVSAPAKGNSGSSPKVALSKPWGRTKVASTFQGLPQPLTLAQWNATEGRSGTLEHLLELISLSSRSQPPRTEIRLPPRAPSDLGTFTNKKW